MRCIRRRNKKVSTNRRQVKMPTWHTLHKSLNSGRAHQLAKPSSAKLYISVCGCVQVGLIFARNVGPSITYWEEQNNSQENCKRISWEQRIENTVSESCTQFGICIKIRKFTKCSQNHISESRSRHMRSCKSTRAILSGHSCTNE